MQLFNGAGAGTAIDLPCTGRGWRSEKNVPAQILSFRTGLVQWASGELVR